MDYLTPGDRARLDPELITKSRRVVLVFFLVAQGVSRDATRLFKGERCYVKPQRDYQFADVECRHQHV
jgi:hypothetical protein